MRPFSFLLACFVAMGLSSSARSAERTQEKLAGKVLKAEAIPPGGLMKAQTFRLSAGLYADLGKGAVSASKLKVRPHPYMKKKFVKMATAAQPVLGPYLRNHQAWQQATALMKDSRFDYINPIDQDSLKTAYAARQSELDAMLPQADSLDVRNQEMVDRKAELDQTKANLRSEIDQYNGQVADHNARCNPAPDEQTYQWCLQDGTRLETWKSSIQGEIADYNSAVSKFNADLNAFNLAWDAAVNAILDWEAKVNDLIAKIQAAFARVRGNCTEEQHQPLQDDVDAKCKIPRACSPGQTCEQLKANLGKNQACYDARVKLVQICFDGKPDAGHQQALDDTARAMDNCKTLIIGVCGSGIGATRF